MTEIQYKRCTKCKQEFPATPEYFHIHKQCKYGLNSQCKECANKKGRNWYENNKEYKLNQNRDWYDSHPEKVKEKGRKRYWSNPEKERARSADYKKQNPDKIKVKSKSWAKNHPEKIREQSRIRRARKAKAAGTHTIEDEKLQFKTQKGLCWWCGELIEGQYHVDHRIALSRGGSDYANNICISCPKCNESKHNKMPWEWNGRLL